MPASQDAQEHAVQRAGRIFAVIKRAADAGETCPTNDTLAERFSCGTTSIVNALAFLEAAGMIAVARGNAQRVVTIIATGHKTAGTVGKPHWSRRRAA